MIELAAVLARHWPEYLQRFGARLLPSQRRAAQAILACRTPQLGGQRYRCADCGREHFAYHSCNNRACPKCGHADATHWIAQQRTRLLPAVPYFMVTFTVPQELRRLIRSKQKEIYTLLFRESAATLQEIAATPRHLGAELGMLGVLHTWTRQLIYHPHIHYVVAGAGLSPNGLHWKRVPDTEYFLPEKVLARRFRNRLRRALARQHPEWLAPLPTKTWHRDWVVDSIPVGTGDHALKYLSAYVYRTAIASTRILEDSERGITFRYRDSADGQWRTCTVSAMAFLRRFLQHVLPQGFQRVRYYGWLGSAASAKWNRILALLDWRRPDRPLRRALPAPDCPHCRRPMMLLGRLTRAPP